MSPDNLILILLPVCVILPWAIAYAFSARIPGFAWMLAGMLAWIGIVSILMITSVETRCDRVTVVEIGGCDRYGWCGYRGDDGNIRAAKLPVPGGIMSTCANHWK